MKKLTISLLAAATLGSASVASAEIVDWHVYGPMETIEYYNRQETQPSWRACMNYAVEEKGLSRTASRSQTGSAAAYCCDRYNYTNSTCQKGMNDSGKLMHLGGPIRRAPGE